MPSTRAVESGRCCGKSSSGSGHVVPAQLDIAAVTSRTDAARASRFTKQQLRRLRLEPHGQWASRAVVDVERVRDGVTDLLRSIDVIIAAQAFPTALTGYSEPGRALTAIAEEYGSPLVAVTLGKGQSLRFVWRAGASHAGVSVSASTPPAPATPSTAVRRRVSRDPQRPVEDAMRYANAGRAQLPWLRCAAACRRCPEIDALLIGGGSVMLGS